MQRLPPVGVARHALADYLEAAIGHGGRRWFVWLLYEVQQT